LFFKGKFLPNVLVEKRLHKTWRSVAAEYSVLVHQDPNPISVTAWTPGNIWGILSTFSLSLYSDSVGFSIEKTGATEYESRVTGAVVGKRRGPDNEKALKK
jgi:hypothetical protein